MPDSDRAQPARPAPPDDELGALAPFRHGVFTMLWSTWLVANLCMWMNDVAAAWLMTTLTAKPIWVALVQTAATLPVFLLGLPSGALADILNRKHFLFFTQVWVAVVGGLLALAVFLEAITPPLLLLLLFLNGIGLALRWPVFSAIVPELVPRGQLPAALALNGISMNASRIVGPLVAGALIASAGTEYVFVLNAVLSIISGFLIMRWRREHVPSPLGRERLLSAMRVGLQFVSQSTRLRAVLLRVALFFLHSTALLALLPLLARGLDGGDAGTFTLLLASMGSGAIVAALFLPRLRQMMDRDTLVVRSVMLQSASTFAMALAPNAWVAVPAMVLNGMAWITCANALSVSAQLALPDWVRARGMSMYQMAIMGASALGAALWGQVATLASVPLALCVAAATGVISIVATNRWMPHQAIEEDLTPARYFQPPEADEPPATGHVMVTIEYRIDPARADEFRALMLESRRSRLSHGALSWELLRDLGEPGRFVEQIVDPSWNDHLRRFERITAADAALRERKLAFHIGESPPVVTRSVMESTVRDE